MSRVLCLDPGSTETGYVVLDRDTLKPLEFAKVKNGDLVRMMMWKIKFDEFVTERMESFGMGIGRTTLIASEWVGRFSQVAEILGYQVNYIYRHTEKIHICHDSRAKDSNIRRALIDRFAQHDFKNGKGTKSNPDWFYGVSKDCWSAIAVGICFVERGPDESGSDAKY